MMLDFIFMKGKTARKLKRVVCGVVKDDGDGTEIVVDSFISIYGTAVRFGFFVAKDGLLPRA
jgi:hypothetical protein